jgi:surface protein
MWNESVTFLATLNATQSWRHLLKICRYGVAFEGMFFGCHLFNSDVSAWNVSNAINMRDMFNGCESFQSDVSRWNMARCFKAIFSGRTGIWPTTMDSGSMAIMNTIRFGVVLVLVDFSNSNSMDNLNVDVLWGRFV